MEGKSAQDLDCVDCCKSEHHIIVDMQNQEASLLREPTAIEPLNETKPSKNSGTRSTPRTTEGAAGIVVNYVNGKHD